MCYSNSVYYFWLCILYSICNIWLCIFYGICNFGSKVVIARGGSRDKRPLSIKCFHMAWVSNSLWQPNPAPGLLVWLKGRVYITFRIPFCLELSKYAQLWISADGWAQHMRSTTWLALYQHSRMRCCTHTVRAVSKNCLRADRVHSCPRALLMMKMTS